MLFCLDPGHSGPREPGACFHEVREADLNLALARQAARALRQGGAEVMLTREEDIADDGLAWRARLANEAGCAAFLSVHCNAACPGVRGIETYHYPGSSAGLHLAQAVQASLVSLGYSPDRGVKEATFTVLAATEMPAVLAECGFLTAAADRAVLCDPAWQEAIGRALASALLQAFS